ncbi:pimeloyl-ACP methyl ester carboxylesterase [Rhodovulum iodosum]|uniref:Pimeloyl-ACP methyl ester carboxylesterase n=1 Tax=Rhodovulum iodosum TaxID=68291 RepID=A0ABV3XV97_9RHOB|nr:alpha/beta hydrolase [Rhodovulum robiginosum]RSK35054.1 alpha/beta hydrolase [Rhodovulum robiginosum]
MLRRADPPDPSGRLLSIRGGQVHAHVQGTGPDLVLIHGAGGNLRDFTFHLVGRLAPRYRVIAFDRPGLGHSTPLHENGESPIEQAAVLAEAAELLEVKDAILVGHSYGGAVAMAWALNHPANVAGLVSLAGALMPWKGGLGAWYQIAASGIGGAVVVPLVAALVPRRLAAPVLDKIFAPQHPPAGYAAHLGIELSLRPQALRANVRQVNGLKPHLAAMAPRYPGLSVPIEIVHGTADEIVPIEVHSRPFAARVPSARLTELPGVGHMPHHARPEEAIAAIDRAANRAGRLQPGR